MFQTSVARLVEDNREKLALAWVGEPTGGEALIRQDAPEAAAFVGHLNLIHPNRIQVLGRFEDRYLAAHAAGERAALIEQLLSAKPAAVICADGLAPPAELAAAIQVRRIALLATPQPAALVIDKLRRYLGKRLAETVERHGVLMDVLGLGVLITGESGVGKSELALELISRGHGLVADDIVEIARTAATSLEGRCPTMLKDFLEVRGLGVLNIRTIFGETAVRPRMNLRLVVHLERPASGTLLSSERLPLIGLTEEILGIDVAKVALPVAAGRNLAVLLEAAVRNHILKLRGIDSTAEFIERQRQAIGGAERP